MAEGAIDLITGELQTGNRNSDQQRWDQANDAHGERCVMRWGYSLAEAFLDVWGPLGLPLSYRTLGRVIAIAPSALSPISSIANP